MSFPLYLMLMLYAPGLMGMYENVTLSPFSSLFTSVFEGPSTVTATLPVKYPVI